MARTRLAAFATIAALAAAMFAGGLQQKEAPPLAAPPLVQWCGHQTKSPQTGFVVVRDEATWQKLWSAHTGGTPDGGGAMERHGSPKIDFGRCCVVAYFHGAAVNTDGEVAESVSDLADRVVVRFEPSTFQTASFDGNGGAEHTRPFGIWVIPATTKAIAIEEATRPNHLKSDAIEWREVKRFEASASRPSGR